ncbi:MAG: FUSC family protein [Comamonadaceae bacterium]|nr:MAG: FUSC family protein [Comamonadaceae bacterium]
MMLEQPLLRLKDRLLQRFDHVLRVALSQYVTNGLTVTLGLVLIMLAIFETAGLAGATTAAVGVLITSLPDLPAPRKRKIMQMLPAPVMSLPLFVLVQLVRQDPVFLGVVLVAGSFLAVMLMAWGKRGGPICFSLLISMMFSMAAPVVGSLEEIAIHAGWFAGGATLYLLWGTLTTNLLNRRYRAQMLAECIHSFAKILRTQAARFAPEPDHQALLASMLQQQAALAEHLQNTRDVVLESPTKPGRQRLAAMLLSLLEARDHQLACDLDLDFLLKHSASISLLPALEQTLQQTAARLDALSLSLLLGLPEKSIDAIPDLRPQLTGVLPERTSTRDPLEPDPLQTGVPDTASLLHNMADRIGHINDEAVKLAALARGEVAPELAAVRNQWQLFVSATTWSWRPLLGQLTWRAPTLRYALRASMAMGAGYVISMHLPWVSHEYWILLTIMVVMRGNLSQTLERRNARVAGTLAGCVAVMFILAAHPEARVIFLIVALSTGLAHAFALRRYLYTSIAATVSGLLQAHMLLVGIQPTFAVFERIADTILGAVLAWLFSYVLPAWERNQTPALVRRSVLAQKEHARLALSLLDPAKTSDLQWRLARREAYNSLSDLTLATQRSLAEPANVRPPLEPLEALQARSYQLLAQLTAVKSMLLLRRGQLDMAIAEPALAQAGQCIAAELAGSAVVPPPPSAPPAQPSPDKAAALEDEKETKKDQDVPARTALPTDPAPPSQEATFAGSAVAGTGALIETTPVEGDPTAPSIAGQPFQPRPDPLLANDLTPWLLRRLTLACAMARELRQAAGQAQVRRVR